jgi:hypothetical protein
MGLTGVFDRRFLMHVFFPSLVFWGLLLAVWFGGQEQLAEAVRRWRAQGGFEQSAQAACFVVGVYVFAMILSGKLHALLRLYEGYWDFPGARALKERGTTWYRHVLKNLYADPRRYDDIYYGFPLERKKVMPTRFGNILKNAEMYPTERYQMDAVQVWPRLYGLLPENLSQALALSRSGMEHMLVWSVLGAAFAIAAGVYLLIVQGAWWLFLLCFWGGLAVAASAYRSALGSAMLYGTQIKVAFDLHRNELLKQLRKPLPQTQVSEKRTWSKVCQFLYRNEPKNSPDWIYVDHEPQPEKSAEREAEHKATEG